MGTMGTWGGAKRSAHALLRPPDKPLPERTGQWVLGLSGRGGGGSHLGLHCKVEGTTFEG